VHAELDGHDLLVALDGHDPDRLQHVILGDVAALGLPLVRMSRNRHSLTELFRSRS